MPECSRNLIRRVAAKTIEAQRNEVLDDFNGVAVKPLVIARVAVMRRLATIIWSMVRHGMPYCVGGPEEAAKQRRLVHAFA